MNQRLFVLLAASAILAGCAERDTQHVMRISVPDQHMSVYRNGTLIASYPVSTSKFGVGDQRGSYRTPLGKMEVAKKIGDGAPLGMKFKSRRATGEIVPVDAPGRDPIVTRILWLRGLEGQNAKAFDRGIYIHGTAEERNVGRPASYGCIRMKSRDVISLFNTVGVGARVEVTMNSLGSPALAQNGTPPGMVPLFPGTPPSAAAVNAPSAKSSARSGAKRGQTL